MDWVATNPAGVGRRAHVVGKQRILGEKPVDFVVWVLACCRVARDDSVEDVFPGSGAVAEAVDIWRRQALINTGPHRRPEQLEMEDC